MKHNAADIRWILGATLAGLFAAACNPSPHLDPPTAPAGGSGGSGGGTTSTGASGGSGGDTTSSSSSTGGSTGSGCKSNADCAYPQNLCDVASGTCVECLTTSDCDAKPGTVCSEASCKCPQTTDTFCPADGTGAARCVDLDTAGNDCGECGHKCFGACAAGACSDAWEPTATAGAPSGRSRHVAVWTGSLMIVWGGENNSGQLSDGATYNPDTGVWTPVSNANAPSARADATAVWNGTEMIVWGGRGPGGTALGDGAKYNPATNTWSNVASGGPSARYQHGAIWTDNQVLRMMTWGGYDGADELATGGYLTSGNTWLEVNPLSAPTKRRLHSTVWDDVNKRMIVFGGLGFDPSSGTTTSLATGGIYGPLPGNEAWVDIAQIGSPPAPRYEHCAVWASTHMLVWGGNNNSLGLLGDGARFDFAGNNEWSAMNGVAPAPRRRHTCVFFKALNRMVVWGGYGAGNAILGDGGAFDSAGGMWTDAGVPKGPAPSVDHTAVVAGGRMIVWGGITSGGAYTEAGAVLDMAKVP
ncbi:MAG: hypothetical protein IPK82_05635 [Polyangiaceae bacterium]|nr:hypothetical protein [Polyangiaceae bacterium]